VGLNEFFKQWDAIDIISAWAEPDLCIGKMILAGL